MALCQAWETYEEGLTNVLCLSHDAGRFNTSNRAAAGLSANGDAEEGITECLFVHVSKLSRVTL